MDPIPLLFLTATLYSYSQYPSLSRAVSEVSIGVSEYNISASLSTLGCPHKERNNVINTMIIAAV